MKKNSQETALFNSDLAINKDTPNKKIVTTDINILLNRVKLEKKNNLRKKIIFISILFSILSSATFFVII
jgi:hypothetical protein